MGHFTALAPGEKSRYEKTRPEWLQLGSQLGDMANQWSGRSDIIAYVGDGAGMGVSVACFIPSISEMEINVEEAFGESVAPEFVPDLTVRSNQFDYPAVMGAVLHEAFHAKHSKFDLGYDHDNPFVKELVTSFEETRIEARAVAAFPENRAFLRASAMKLALADILDSEDDFAAGGHQSFSQLMLLSLARVDAGVLDPSDVERIRTVAVDTYGEELYGQLRALWIKAQEYSADYEVDGLIKIAEAWVKLLEDSGHDTTSENDKLREMLEKMLGSGSGEGGKGGEDSDGDGPGGMLADMVDAIEIMAGDEAAARDIKERMDAIAEARKELAEESSTAKRTAEKVFGKGTGPAVSGGTSSRLYERRAPTSEERASAVSLARALEQARYQDRVVTKRTSQIPSGRLRSRAAVQASAERTRGAIVTAEPWKDNRRVHTDDPELKVGLLVDISGSMHAAMRGMGVTSWVVSEAVRRVQGKAAAVYYGNDVWVGMAPGQHLDQVETYSAPDMTETFNKAFKALDGEMEMLQGSGARVVFIISDLHYGADGEAAAFRRWAKRMKETGVALVVAVPTESDRRYAEAKLGNNGTVITPRWSDPASVANDIGKAVVDQLSKQGNRQ